MTERVIHRRQSSFNEIFVRRDELGVVTLQFEEDGACQSAVKPDDPDYLELPYSMVLPLFLGFVPAPQRMLVVGLGGGTVPKFFHHRFPEITIDVIEIDSAVVEVAQQFCGFTQDDRMYVHIGDGRDFVEAHSSLYDVIVLDGFDAEEVPRHLCTVEFLSAARRALRPGGVVVGNVWGPRHNRNYKASLATYLEAFAEFYVLDVPAPGTKIFIGLCEPQGLNRQQLLARADQVFEKRGFWFGAADVLDGFGLVDRADCDESLVIRD